MYNGNYQMDNCNKGAKMSVWDNYDKWKLRSPEEFENQIEVFETEKFGYVSNEEDDINSFDNLIKLAIKDDCIYLHICDDLEEYADYLADELTLYADEYELISTLEENHQDAIEEAAERKGEAMREDRQMGDD